MKEERFFYDPTMQGRLPEDEARHAARVLRLKPGDEVFLMDGRGTFYSAELTAVSNHQCLYRILQTLPQEAAWQGHLHLAIAPTKLNDRTEWFAEKATEIGFDELSFIDCRFSERRTIKTERIDRILVSAIKQSRKAWKPTLHEMQSFGEFVASERPGDKFICHCYDMQDIASAETKPYLGDILQRGVPTTVMIGPEGDFSIEEVRLAESHGFRSVSLGRSRLRTETAALVAVHLMQIANQIKES